MSIFSGSTASVCSSSDLMELTGQGRDRQAWEAVEQRAAAVAEGRKRVAAMKRQTEMLVTEADKLVEQMLRQLDMGLLAISFNSSSASLVPPCADHKHQHCGREGLLYGCREVYCQLYDQLSRLQLAVTVFDLLEENPLSSTGAFRQEAGQLKLQIRQFQQRVTGWAKETDKKNDCSQKTAR